MRGTDMRLTRRSGFVRALMALLGAVRAAAFWAHLIVAVMTGVVVVILCVTGVLLAYEPQVERLAELWGTRRPVAEPGARRLPTSALVVAATAAVAPGNLVRSVGVSADPRVPARVRLFLGENERLSTTVLVDPIHGRIVDADEVAADSERRRRVEGTFTQLRGWHGWLGRRTSESTTVARLITGGSTVALVFLVVSGLFLWWPRRWTRSALRAIVVPAWGRRGKARDFNWHNSLGFWAAPVLLAVALTGVWLSALHFEWARPVRHAATQALSRRSAGSSQPPVAAALARRLPPEAVEGTPRGRGRDVPVVIDAAMLDTLWVRAARAVPPGWKGLDVMFPTARDSTILARASYAKAETVDLELSPGGAILLWRHTPPAGGSDGDKVFRFMHDVHTGRVGGILGQTLALLASVVGVVLVWTGFSLALRRFGAWRKRRARFRVEAGRQLIENDRAHLGRAVGGSIHA